MTDDRAAAFIAANPIPLADCRMAVTEQLLYGGYSMVEAESLLALYEAAVLREVQR